MHALFLFSMSRQEAAPSSLPRNTPDLDDEELIQRWVEIARRYYPELAKPISRAMAQRAARGPFGPALRKIEEGMLGLDESAIGEMTGSELQMLSAILQQLQEEIGHRLTRISGQWPTQ